VIEVALIDWPEMPLLGAEESRERNSGRRTG
jgi:hypothetical protein